ncbi:hypothetical protein [Chryseobacterium binzhouense]|nr:hypothetical protein [Chryseobacterium binzhouense]
MRTGLLCFCRSASISFMALLETVGQPHPSGEPLGKFLHRSSIPRNGTR